MLVYECVTSVLLCRADSFWGRICVAVRCSVLQCVAVRCSALQCVAVRCSALLNCADSLWWWICNLRARHGLLHLTEELQCTAPHCTTLHHTAPHCTTLHHTAPHCTTLHHTAPLALYEQDIHCCTSLKHLTTTRFSKNTTLQPTATYCNTCILRAGHGLLHFTQCFARGTPF